MFSALANDPWWAWLILGLLAGFILGSLITDRHKRDGVIHVARSEEKDRYLFEFNIPPEDVPKMKQVVFEVRLEDSSQEIQSP